MIIVEFEYILYLIFDFCVCSGKFYLSVEVIKVGGDCCLEKVLLDCV